MNRQEAKLYIGTDIRAVLRCTGADAGKVVTVTASVLEVTDDDSIHLAYNGQSLWMRLSDVAKVPFGVRETPGDWPEDFHHENGCYMCKCFTCGNLFNGHKRRPVCKLCSENPESVE